MGFVISEIGVHKETRYSIMSEDEVCKVMRTFTFQPLFFSVSIRGLYLVCLCAMANFEYFL